MPTLSDHIFVVIFAVIYPAYVLITYPKFRREAAANKPGVRVREYRETIIAQWILAAGAVLVWSNAERPVADLGLGLLDSWRFWLGLGLALAAIFALNLQLRAIERSEENRSLVRDQLQPIIELLPHDRKEMAHFAGLSITAGICEELLFRGFLIWYLAQFAGITLAVLLSSLLFGIAHLYQGVQGVIKAGTAGIVFAGLYVLTGSLWAPMLLHAYMDISSGQIAYLALRQKNPATVEG